VNFEQLSTRDEALLLTFARRLRRFADARQEQSLLRGKNLGLLCDLGDSEPASRFRRAATDLGARVALIHPDLSPASSDVDIAETGRMLGRLYDGIECLGIDASVVKRLGAAAKVPVYDGISAGDHPTAKLAARLGAEDVVEQCHRFVIQAVLLSTLDGLTDVGHESESRP